MGRTTYKNDCVKQEGKGYLELFHSGWLEKSNMNKRLPQSCALSIRRTEIDFLLVCHKVCCSVLLSFQITVSKQKIQVLRSTEEVRVFSDTRFQTEGGRKDRLLRQLSAQALLQSHVLSVGRFKKNFYPEKQPIHASVFHITKTLYFQRKPYLCIVRSI